MEAPAKHGARVLSIHYLRGIAALMIVFVHIFGFEVIPMEEAARPEWLKRGVAIFFVISGFVMTVSTEKQSRSPGDFILRRLIRVVPFYWAMLTIWVIIGAPWDFSQLVGSYLFVPTPDPAMEVLRAPVLGPGWTLNYEMAFYAAFALFMLLPRKWCIWGLAGLLFLLAQVKEMASPSLYIAYYFDPVLMEFALGMLIAHCRVRLPAVCVVLGFAGLALLPQFGLSHVLTVSIPAAMIVAGARSLDGKLPDWRFPVLLGDASYAIYLSHPIVIMLALAFVTPLGMPVLSGFAVMAGSIVTGVLIHRRIEKPLIAHIRKMAHPTPTPTPPPRQLAQVP